MNNFNSYYTNSTVDDIQSLKKFTTKSFGLMFIGVLITFFTAFIMISSGLVIDYILMTNNMFFVFIPFILQLVLIISIQRKAQSLNSSTAMALFFIYSIIEGVAISPIIVVYNVESAIFAFIGAALFFGGMALYGLVTKRNLLKLAPVFAIGFISLLLYNVLAVVLSFLGFNIINSTADLIISSIGLLLFIGVTAFDVQKMKSLYYSNVGDDRRLKAISIISALELHLDFMGIFLYILRIFGNNRD